MAEATTFIDFVVEIACMTVPVEEVETIGISRDESIVIALVALGFLLLSLLASAAKEALATNTGAAVIIAVCVAGLGYIGLDRDLLRGAFVVGYPPLVIAVRFVEGALLGTQVSQSLRWWHAAALGGVITAACLLLRSVPSDTRALALGSWALLGAGLAAFALTRIAAGTPLVRSPLSAVALFTLFASTLTYVSASPPERALYAWSLPFGFFAGALGGRLPRT